MGEWKDDKKHGQGTYIYGEANTGNKYVGEYKDNRASGQGTYTWADGSTYVGEYKDGKKHGQGTLIYASGNKYVGIFEDDLFTGKKGAAIISSKKDQNEFKTNKFKKSDKEALTDDNEIAARVEKSSKTKRKKLTTKNVLYYLFGAYGICLGIYTIVKFFY